MQNQYGRKHHEIQGEVSILVERNLWESNAFGYFGHTGKAPQAGFLCLEHNHLAPARLGLEGRECKRAVGEIRWGGSS